jgi:hypothetical protein
MTFTELFRDIETFDKQLAAPVELHAAKLEPYHRSARLVASRVLLAAMPAENQTSPEAVARWKHRVEVTLDRITTELMLGGWGMILSISSPPDAEGNLDPKESRPQDQRVDHKDVVEWIRAGLAGEQGGKRITARDKKILDDPRQGEKGLATIVMRAYYSRKAPPNYIRLRKAIQRYLSGAVDDATGNSLLDAVATAWVEHFSVRFPRDLKTHVSRLVRQF